MSHFIPRPRRALANFPFPLAGPAYRRHRTPRGGRAHQRFQAGDQGRIMGLEGFAPAPRPPNPPVIRTLWRMMVTQLVTPAADRPFPQARGLGHRLQPAVPQFEGFAGRPAAPSSLIEIRLKAGELSSEDFDNASVYHVINVVQIDEIGQLFIYDDMSVLHRIFSPLVS